MTLCHHKKGDLSLFIESYIQYYPRICHYLIPLLEGDIHSAEDITQEVFTRLFINAGSLDRRIIHKWLFSASRYVLLEHYRKNNKNIGDDVDELVALEDEALAYM